MSDKTTTGLCCALRDEFIKYIHLDNIEMSTSCDPAQCNTLAFMQHLRHETNGVGSVNEYDIIHENMDGSSVDTADVTVIASLLVWAYIGRHYTSSAMGSDVGSSHKHLFFKFHPSSQVLRAIQPSCTFERTIYLAMIVLTILVLVFIILARHIPMEWRLWSRAKEPNDAQQYTRVPDSENSSTNQGAVLSSSSSFQPSSAIDFSQLRQR